MVSRLTCGNLTTKKGAMGTEIVELTQDDHDAIEALLLGRRIVGAEREHVAIPGAEDRYYSDADGVLTLDDGTRIYVQGHEGGCSCGAGDYALKHLAAVDNVITSVRFDDHPAGDDYDDLPDYDSDDYTGETPTGWYRIFVVADAAEVNVASFEGSDGNGYYGTGYSLYMQRVPDAESSQMGGD